MTGVCEAPQWIQSNPATVTHDHASPKPYSATQIAPLRLASIPEPANQSTLLGEAQAECKQTDNKIVYKAIIGHTCKMTPAPVHARSFLKQICYHFGPPPARIHNQRTN